MKPEPEKAPVSDAATNDFINFMRAKWTHLRSVANGANIAFQNIGNEHRATFACAFRLREVTGLERYFSTRLGYPMFTVPNTELAKFLAGAGKLVSIALIDTGEERVGSEVITKPVTLYVVHPPAESVVRTIRTRDEPPPPAQPTLNLQGTLTGRTRSDIPNESAKPKPGPVTPKKKVIRER